MGVAVYSGTNIPENLAASICNTRWRHIRLERWCQRTKLHGAISQSSFFRQKLDSHSVCASALIWINSVRIPSPFSRSPIVRSGVTFYTNSVRYFVCEWATGPCISCPSTEWLNTSGDDVVFAGITETDFLRTRDTSLASDVGHTARGILSVRGTCFVYIISWGSKVLYKVTDRSPWIYSKAWLTMQLTFQYFEMAHACCVIKYKLGFQSFNTSRSVRIRLRVSVKND